MDRLSVQDLKLKGKKALIRVDFNVPLNNRGEVADDTRIIASLPTIKYVLEQGGAVILMSHLGRPKGKSSPELSLAPVAAKLGNLLGKAVTTASDCVGAKVEKLAKELKAGQILLLENLRFHAAEEHPEEDPEFAGKLASLGDVYINDAFGTAHRAHSSTVKVAEFFPQASACGLLLEKEMRFLGDTLKYPKRPFYTLIGGAKVSSKIGVLKALLPKVDGLIIGGAMAFTFLKAQGIEIGDSLFEPDYLEEARKVTDRYVSAKKIFLLPQDLVVAKEIQEGAASHVVTIKEGVPKGYKGVDIGPKTIERYKEELTFAKTVLWNGPMGVFEVKAFSKGTYEMARSLAELEATTIVGGGDSVFAIQNAHLAHEFSHISTGGGASLEYLEHGTLPGIEALTKV